MDGRPKSSGLLGDTSARDYSRKLAQFNSFAERELRQAIRGLLPGPGARVLDAGCGTGETLRLFVEQLGADGVVVGIDLSTAHVAAARRQAFPHTLVAQGYLQKLPFSASSFDLVWCVNTINHMRDPADTAARLAALLRPGGHIAVGQSSLLPDMYFAWNARLERLVTEAVRQYYRERYGLDERELTAIRGLVGVLLRAGLSKVHAQTFVIERTFPLGPDDEAYLFETIFRDTWGTRLQPYLSADDYDELTQLCNPHSPEFALRRPDFHFLQTLTVVSGEV